VCTLRAGPPEQRERVGAAAAAEAARLRREALKIPRGPFVGRERLALGPRRLCTRGAIASRILAARSLLCDRRGPLLYVPSVWLHVVAATVWVGSMVFFAAVVVPVARRADVRAAAPLLFRVMGARFRVLGRISLGVLIVTGVSNLYLRGIGTDVMGYAEFWATPFGRTLSYKLVFVTATLAATTLHEWTASRTTLAHGPGSDEAERSRRLASWVGRGIMVASLCILFFAVTLVRGLP